MLTKDGIRTLVEFVIVDSTKANLFCRYYITQGFVAFKIAQAKERSYHDQHLTNLFFC